MNAKTNASKLTFVRLNRRFIPWADEKATIEMASVWERSVRGHLEWTHLLEHQRIIVLAEAGSGKSEELEDQARSLSSEGKPVFHLTVQELAKDGLAGALTNAKRTELENWKSANGRGYFFIDSIDEAKLDSIRIESAFKKLADGIDGALGRATIIFSGRYTDWEFQSDLHRFESMLPAVPTDEQPTLPLVEILEKLLNNEWGEQKKTGPEKPIVVLMASLDKDQVRLFAKAKGISQVDTFIAAIDAEGLWELAHRPLDLGWLVDYWQTHKRFGTLAEMIAANVSERLKETNPSLARKDPLSEVEALRALERVGAAMVFGRADRILIPDPEISHTEGDFKLESILPDWSEGHRNRLRARPIFDAATFGRIRLHNDNEGAVRSYLAARWLKHRRDNGSGINAIYDLLFAETYDIKLVKPSVAQTAAWLAIWEPEVATRIIDINPVLLLKGGDPGSLTLETRVRALKASIGRIIASDRWYGWMDWPSLRRFSSADLAPTLKRLWAEHAHRDVRHLLLQLMVAGGLSDCLDLAVDVVLGPETDRTSRVLASRLVVKFADRDVLKSYAEVIASRGAALSSEELDETIVVLFPEFLSVEQLLSTVTTVSSDERNGLRLKHVGPELADKLVDAGALDELVRGLSARIAPATDDDPDDDPIDEKTCFPILQRAVERLVAAIPDSEVSETAVAATMRLGARRLYRSNGPDLSKIYARLHATQERRRAGVWHAFGHLNGTGFFADRELVNPHQMDMFGWSPGLRAEDLTWLLEDAIEKPTEAERTFAFVGALTVWRDAEKPEAMLAQIEKVARPIPPLATFLDGWLAPPVESEWEKQHNRDMKRIRSKNAAAKTKRTKSWVKFVDELKADPNALRNLPKREDNSADARLFYFYELLNAASRGGSRYQIDDVTALEPVFGGDVVEAARDGLINYWRPHKPTVDSEKAPEKLNSVSKLDCMGLVGISLEAARNPDWATALTSPEAERAAAYATIELNGFPTWFDTLGAAKPTEVSRVLMCEIAAQIGTEGGRDHGMLQDVSYASVEIARLVADELLFALETNSSLTGRPLSTTLSILVKGLVNDASRQKLSALALARFSQTEDVDAAGSYLYAGFSIDAAGATAALSERLSKMEDADQSEFCKAIFPRVFGDRITDGGIDPSVVPFDVLERLVGLAYRTIKLEDDRRHPMGKAYTLNDRDRAEGARSALYNRLTQTPGQATVEALRRVGPIIGVDAERTEELVAMRAGQDSESGKWAAVQAFEMERDFDVAPQNPADLQKIAMRRISDIDHDAHNADFAQGTTLKALGTEAEVQIWVGNELRNRRHRGYSTERESEVVGNNRPDIRLRAGDISLPIEVKVAESWTLPELEAALATQLEGRYLLHQDARHGVLLIVHQHARPRGWQGANGAWLSFAQVVAFLKVLAVERSGVSHDAAKAVIAVIDVSDL